MKILKLLISFTLLNLSLKAQQNLTAQCTPQSLFCEYDPNWNWLDDQNNQFGNWDARVQGSNINMGSPFSTAFPPTQDLIVINNASDYLPQQGWVLLARDFGCTGSNGFKDVSAALPFFILYNKYRSVVRLFLYFDNINPNNKASIRLKWNSTINPSNSDNSLLTLTNKLAKPNVSYPVGNNNEIHLNYLNTVPNSGGWTVTEFQVHFDPNTINSSGQFRFLEFNLSLGNFSGINLASTEFNFTTESATAKEPTQVPTNQNPPGILNYIADAKEFLGKIPKASDVSNGFTSIISTTDTLNKLFHTKFTRDLKKSATELNNGDLKKFLVGTATIAEQIVAGKYLDVASQVLGLFIGKSNSTVASSAADYIQPTVSRGSIKLQGTISTEINPKNIFLQVPGTSHKFENGNLNCSGLPVYDCPLGLVSLQEAPTIEMKKHAIYAGPRTYTISVPLTSNPFNTQILGQNILEQFNSYRVTSNLIIALNGAVGVTVKSIKASLVATQDPSIQPNDTTYALLSGKPFSKGFGVTGYNELTVPPTHPQMIGMNWSRFGIERGYISNNIFQLNAMNINTKEYSYSTPFVDLASFKNTVIIAQPAMKIYIKIQVVMLPTNPNDDQTPIVYVIPYDLSGKIIDVGSSDPILNGPPPKFTCAQMLDDINLISNSTINNGVYEGINLKTNGNVTVNANHPSILNVNFKGANSVKLTPGFTGKAINTNFFKVEIGDVGQCLLGTNALVLNTYFQNCTASALDRKAHQSSEDLNNSSTINDKLKMYILPNPNSGEFKIMFNQNIDSGNIKIINTLGQTVYSSILSENNSIHNLNLESILVKGTYYLTWNNSTQNLNTKFIIE